MIKTTNIDVYGFDHAIRAMRNPMNSWEMSDSTIENSGDGNEKIYVGEKDLDLMRRLFRSGVEHRTYARMIQIWMDIEAPLYWWKEMDRYTVGKSQVSTSTMHKIHSKEFTMDDFSHDQLDLNFNLASLYTIVSVLNKNREAYLETKDKRFWYNMIQLLPSSYNQKRTVNMSYETAMKIIRERRNHKLEEWKLFVNTLEWLPMMKEIMEEA